MTIITSKSNPLIKRTKKLLQKKHRKDSYLIEGWHLFDEAQKSNAKFRHIFVLEEMADQLTASSEIVLVSSDVLKEISDAPTPQGIVAEVILNKVDLPDFKTGRYLVLEDVQDPGNLGTMVRTADAAGLDGVILSDKSADLYNPKTLRSMQGSHFHLPVYRQSLTSIFEQMKTADLPVLATTLSDKSVDYQSLAHFEKFALVMGNEGQGISPETSELADHLVHINMPGQAESLNVAVAAGIVIFSLL
ncbi:TrmH family RNA methyltransferase [Streptococcus pluranimalium]|uniref:TrmH family RNA methyltransferase n=1 Tax=Streptococcus pluranimalium TaxID=82348 RepID=UPI0024155143|nr:RNA methyltransferase [Streptococcus pluranimalium]WFM80244.1 RNA methyltransferase [Streptococcus pluranimalium]